MSISPHKPQMHIALSVPTEQATRGRAWPKSHCITRGAFLPRRRHRGSAACRHCLLTACPQGGGSHAGTTTVWTVSRPAGLRLHPGPRRRHASASRTRRNGDEPSYRLEPDRGEHAHHASRPGWRGAACLPDQHGDGPGRRLRRGQRDHAQASSTVSAQAPFRRDRFEGRRCRDSGVHGPVEHRLDRAREHPVPDQGERAAIARVAIRRLAGRDTRLAAQDQGSRRRERGGGGDDRCP